MRDWRIDSADSLWELVHALTPRSATGGTTADGFQRRGSHINRTIFETLWGDGICPRVPHVTLLGLVAERGEWSGKVNMATDEALKALARLRKHVARLNEAIEASPWARAVYIADSAGALQLVVDESAVLKRLEDRSRSSPRGAPKLVSVTILTQRTERGLAVLCPGEPIQLEVVSAVDGYLHVFHEDLLGQVDDLFALHHATKYVHRHRRVALPTNVLPKGYGWRVARLKRKVDGVQRLIAVVTPLDAVVGERELRMLNIIGSQRKMGITASRPVFREIARGSLGLGEAIYRYCDS